MTAPEPSAVRQAARRIASTIPPAMLRDEVARLLAAAPGRTGMVSSASVDAVRRGFMSTLRNLLELTLADAFDHDEEHLAAIRRLFLGPQERYTLDDLAALWRIETGVAAVVCHDEILRWEAQNAGAAPTHQRITICRDDAITTSVMFGLLRPFDVERALASDFPRARSERWRTIAVLVRLPRFVVAGLSLHTPLLFRAPLAHRIEATLLELFPAENPSAERNGLPTGETVRTQR